jgi:hypothetical protein
MACLQREDAAGEETLHAARHLTQLSSVDAMGGPARRRMLCEAGAIVHGCRALARCRKGGARDAVKALLASLASPDDSDGKKSSSRDIDARVGLRDLAHLMGVDNETLRTRASQTLLGRLDAAETQTARPFASGRLVVTAGQDEYGEPELLKLLMVLAESPLLAGENMMSRDRTKEETACLLRVLRTMAGALTLRAQGQSKEFSKCCVHVITNACHLALPFVLQSAAAGSGAPSRERIIVVDTLSHLACSTQIATALLEPAAGSASGRDVLGVLWSSIALSETRLSAIKTAGHLAASCRAAPGCVSRLALEGQFYLKLLQLAKKTNDKNEMLHCLKALDLMVCDESVAITVSQDRAAVELTVQLLSCIKSDWHESHRSHIQSTTVSILARMAARVEPAARLQMAQLALPKLLQLVVAGPAPVQNVADLAVGNLAKDTPPVVAIFAEANGKADKSLIKRMWTYLATGHPHASYLSLLSLKVALDSDSAREKLGKGDVGKKLRESKVRTIVLQLQANQQRALAKERARVAAEIMGTMIAQDERLHKLAVETQALQACSTVLSSYGADIPVELALPVLQLVLGLCTSSDQMPVPDAQLVHHHSIFLSHGVRTDAGQATSPGAASLLRLIRHEDLELQRAALSCYIAVTVNDSENTYRFAEGLSVSFFSAACSDDSTVRQDAVEHLESLFSGDAGSFGETACVDLGRKAGLGEVFDLATLRAQLGGGPSGNMVRYRCISSSGAVLRSGSEMTSDLTGEDLGPGQTITALEETVNSAGVQRVRCERGWCSLVSATGERVLEHAGSEEDCQVELRPADHPSLLPVRKCAVLSLRRLLRAEREPAMYVEALSRLVVAGALSDTAIDDLHCARAQGYETLLPLSLVPYRPYRPLVPITIIPGSVIERRPHCVSVMRG